MTLEYFVLLEIYVFWVKYMDVIKEDVQLK